MRIKRLLCKAKLLRARVRPHRRGRRHEVLPRRDEVVARLPKEGIGAEVGVWKGDFAANLLQRTKPRRLYLIDPWMHCSGGCPVARRTS
jgi:hypothetical protein